MGGCYSSDSESGMPCPSRSPCDKPTRHKRKGPQYAPLINGNVQQEEGSNAQHSADAVVPSFDSQLPRCVEEGKGVAPSDSGIESLGPVHEVSNQQLVQNKEEISLCRSCHDKLKRISQGSCHQCGNFHILKSELSLVYSETYCSCGPRQAGRTSTCQTHGIRGKPSTSHRHSDIPTTELKSNLKKHRQGRADGKHVRMSWKSTDSMDFQSTMNNCMDRTKSEASDVFGDDVSFRAPLAHFDSMENHLYARTETTKADDGFLASRMSIYSEIVDIADSIFQSNSFDGTSVNRLNDNSSFTVDSYSSGSWGIPSLKQKKTSFAASSAPARLPEEKSQLFLRTLEEEQNSFPRMLRHGIHLESTQDSEMEARLGEHAAGWSGSSFSSSPSSKWCVGAGTNHVTTPHLSGTQLYNYNTISASILETSNDYDMDSSYPVAVMVKGRQMVMMDAQVYRQMLIDLTLLREQLSHLTKVIQEEQDVNQ